MADYVLVATEIVKHYRVNDENVFLFLGPNVANLQDMDGNVLADNRGSISPKYAEYFQDLMTKEGLDD